MSGKAMADHLIMTNGKPVRLDPRDVERFRDMEIFEDADGYPSVVHRGKVVRLSHLVMECIIDVRRKERRWEYVYLYRNEIHSKTFPTKRLAVEAARKIQSTLQEDNEYHRDYPGVEPMIRVK